MILLNNIFLSLQGEGPFSGYPTLFVRLHGCNMHCSWCDTPEAIDGPAPHTLSVPELIDKMNTFSAPHLCITGGEPLVQEEAVINLLRTTAENYKTVSIETNGSLPIKHIAEAVPSALFSVDMKPPSSGNSVFDRTIIPFLAHRGWLKVVVADEEDLQWLEAQFPIIAEARCELFVSPQSGNGTAWQQKVAQWILDHSTQVAVRMQLQLHKQIDID